MNRLLVKLAITAAVGSLLFSSPIAAQNPPPAPKAEHVEITKGPALEISHDDLLPIIRWTTNNPGGDDDHYAVVHYGTDPNDLEPDGEKSHPAQPRPSGDDFPGAAGRLKPATTYYYKVTSMGYDGVERWGGELCQPVHHSRPGSGNQRFPAARVTATSGGPAWITRASSGSGSTLCARGAVSGFCRSRTALRPVSARLRPGIGAEVMVWFSNDYFGMASTRRCSRDGRDIAGGRAGAGGRATSPATAMCISCSSESSPICVAAKRR